MNVLYPFLPEDKFPEAARSLAQATEGLGAMTLRFKSKCNFGLTACLVPECEEDPGLKKLYEACMVACRQFDGFELPSSFSPLLTVGQFKNSRFLLPFLREPCPAVE